MANVFGGTEIRVWPVEWQVLVASPGFLMPIAMRPVNSVGFPNGHTDRADGFTRVNCGLISPELPTV